MPALAALPATIRRKNPRRETAPVAFTRTLTQVCMGPVMAFLLLEQELRRIQQGPKDVFKRFPTVADFADKPLAGFSLLVGRLAGQHTLVQCGYNLVVGLFLGN